MVISVSRRTDIPAFYLEWFFNRINDGYALVRNPMSFHQVSTINLCPNNVDCIVFWTKDPTKIQNRLDDLKDFMYYFQISINGYGKEIEPNVPDKDTVINAFKKISLRVGSNRVVWRYDPIILSDKLSVDYHIKMFEQIAKSLTGYTDLCIISFVDIYNKIKKNMSAIRYQDFSEDSILHLAERFSKIAKRYCIRLETCCEAIDLSNFDISHASCVDSRLISSLLGKDLKLEYHKQRKNCGCMKSFDIGAYDTCFHQCVYCYANRSRKCVEVNTQKHDPFSPMLIGNISKEDVVHNKIAYQEITEQ